MAWMSELQAVRTKIGQLDEDVNAYKPQIEAKPPSDRLGLYEKLIAPLHGRLDTLQKKEERLAAEGAASGQPRVGAGASTSPELHIQQATAGARFVAHFGTGLSCATIISKGWLVSYSHGDHEGWQLGDVVDVWFKPNTLPSSVEDLKHAKAVVMHISDALKSDFVLLKVHDKHIPEMPHVPIISASLSAGGQYIMVGASARSQQLPFSVRHGVILSPYIDEYNHVKGDTPSAPGDSGGACFWVSDGSLFAINVGTSEGACALLPVAVPLSAIKDLKCAPQPGSSGALASGDSS